MNARSITVYVWSEEDSFVLSTNHFPEPIPEEMKPLPQRLQVVPDKIHHMDYSRQCPLKFKRATVLMASGGVYTEGSPIRDRDIATQYLRLILNVIGITDVTFIAAGGAKAVDLGEIGRDDFLDKFQGQIEAEAANAAFGWARRPPDN
ncbi:NAD(P)H-dependent oxidoreductase [Phyllobacterium sp. NPDC097923]|uniref:NAD(P)H-dependent oxidoreductase n=2 Tax=Pseudomonadota TaxID=1224 RepID=UPI001AC51DF5|nr:NAD(P)H-dependent oxidoreductase [Phyllobacterium sp.]